MTSTNSLSNPIHLDLPRTGQATATQMCHPVFPLHPGSTFPLGWHNESWLSIHIWPGVRSHRGRLGLQVLLLAASVLISTALRRMSSDTQFPFSVVPAVVSMTLFFWGMDPDSSLMCPQLSASARVTVNTQPMLLQLNLTLCEMRLDALASHSIPLDRCLTGPASLERTEVY